MSRKRINLRHEGDRGIFKNPHYMGECIYLAQMADVGSFLQRVLANGANIDVFDRRVSQLFGVVERG